MKYDNDQKFQSASDSRELGFTLMETMLALIVIMIAMLGIFAVFTYAINFNAGNNTRAQALAVLQREAELIRSAKFTPGGTDPYAPTAPPLCNVNGQRDLTGGDKGSCTVVVPDNGTFKVETWVDNDPTVAGVQGEADACLSPTGTTIPCTIKEVRIKVSLDNPTPGWQMAIPAETVIRRVRAN